MLTLKHSTPNSKDPDGALLLALIGRRHDVTMAEEDMLAALGAGKIASRAVSLAENGDLVSIPSIEWPALSVQVDDVIMLIKNKQMFRPQYHSPMFSRADIMAVFPPFAYSTEVPVTADVRGTPSPDAFSPSLIEPVRRSVFTKADLEQWYQDRVRDALGQGCGYSREADVKAAQKLFKVSRDRVRELRREFAPSDWKDAGRRPDE